MKETYIVAQNAFSVTAPEGLGTWEEIRPRFTPFASSPVSDRVLEIDIKATAFPEQDAEVIYEPESDGIGFITARASRLTDGSLVMEFMHIADSERRLWMKMPAGRDRAEIIIRPEADSDDSYFLTHAMMLAFMIATCANGTLLIHASSVICDGKAYLFQGKSGTGKSTHASLWTKNIPGTELLNDDHPIIRFSEDGTAIAYGSPWSGKTHCYRNLSAPVGAFVRIRRDDRNFLRKLPPLNAYASLATSIFYLPFLPEALREIRHRMIERLAATIPCFDMHCLPDPAAALLCHAGVTM